jgi:hypothetical protein
MATKHNTCASDAHQFPVTDRRAFLAAAPALALLTAGPASAVMANHDDSVIERTFAEWKAAYRHFNSLPADGSDADIKLLDDIGQLEDVIRGATATTKRGAACQLWVALDHMVTHRDEEAAILREDIGWLLAKDSDFDWHERLILAALRSLTAEA